MNILMLLFPFLVLQLFKKQDAKTTLLSSIGVIASIPLFAFVPVLPFYPLLFLLCLANAIHIRTFGHPLPIRSLKRVRSLPALKDSIKETAPLTLLVGGAFYISIYSYFLKPAPVWTLPLLPLTFLLPIRTWCYPYYAFINLFTKEKRDTQGTLPKRENETYITTDKEYPLEKLTTGFTGERVFSLPKKEAKPHVVFLYLESFRHKEVGVCTPYFDTLIKEGVYFSNFYANATQTFKALFATLYGIPPCFGPDFAESSTSVLTLPVEGLPDLFADRGYSNVFAKAGSMHFERQGEFLHNHGFKHTFDAADIKRANPDATGTSWGVHDEFLYSFLTTKIEESTSPLFLSAATITNHHPFIVPDHFTPKHGTTPFTKCTEYMDAALGTFVENLKKLNVPIDLYIMGDHGYPDNHKNKPSLSPSLDEAVTHVPFLILPLNQNSNVNTRIHSISSQIDILPTLMDIYDMTGKNSALGSSLLRKRKNPTAYLLNESITPISGTVTADAYLTSEGYLPIYNTLAELYKRRRISSSPKDLKVLNFARSYTGPADINDALEKNTNVETLYLDNCPVVSSLDLNFPASLKKLTLDNNILITDEDILLLPNTLTSISIKGCRNLTDATLRMLENLPLREIALTGTNFSNNALKSFFQNTHLKKLEIEEGTTISGDTLHALKDHPLESVILNDIPALEDSALAAFSNPLLKTFMCNNCSHLSDSSLSSLSKSSVEVLHLEKGLNITDAGILSLINLPIHTFYISQNPHLTESSIQQLNSTLMQNLFCIDCKNLSDHVDEGGQKQVYILKNSNL